MPSPDVTAKDSIQQRKDTYTDVEIKAQADKTLSELQLGKIAIVFTPTSSEMLWKGVNSMTENLQKLDYEIVVVVKKGILLESDYTELAIFPKVKYIEVPKIDIFAQKNIGRQLINPEVKYILFLDTLSYIDSDEINFTEKFVKARLAPLFLEPICAVVGELPEQTLSEDIEKEIIDSLSKKVTFNREVYEENCLTKDGRIRFAEANSMAVKSDIWDMFGGFNINDQYPGIEYCIRLQLLGYNIILQQLDGR